MKKKTTITISKGLRNRLRHARNVTFSGSYENLLIGLLERDKKRSNADKYYTNKENW